ncbi:hypothetical protein BD408DRAFT_77009 [Parasitella parasitica]|nr:hypothetical protein BD408DRAFT_77009 [Parasitella parasitica]
MDCTLRVKKKKKKKNLYTRYCNSLLSANMNKMTVSNNNHGLQRQDQLPSIATIRHSHNSATDGNATKSNHHHHSRLLYFLTDPSSSFSKLNYTQFQPSQPQLQPSLLPIASPTFIPFPSSPSTTPRLYSIQNDPIGIHRPSKPNAILPILPPPQPTSQPIAVAAVDDCCNECCPVIAAEANAGVNDLSDQNLTLPSIKKRKRDDEQSKDNAAVEKAKERPTQCRWSSCAASFDTVEDLTPHLFNSHLNKQPLRDCYWGSCGQQFLDGDTSILDHLSSQHLHSALLLHACRWVNCQERFSAFDTLTVHLSRVHVGSGKSEYKCQWTACERNGKAFTQRQKIMRHIQTHTGAKPYQCHTCKRRFSESNMVVQHMRIHTGERPFKCDQCPKEFSVSAALTIHKRVHTGEKPLACRYTGCSKRFSESSNLTKHVMYFKQQLQIMFINFFLVFFCDE